VTGPSDPPVPANSPEKPARHRSTIHHLVLLVRSNWISTTGALISLFGLLSLIVSLYMDHAGVWTGPYLGLLTVMVFPALLFGGGALVPVGLVLYRKHLNERIEHLSDKPVYLVRAVIVITILNVLALGTLGSTGVHYMSSTEFCGATCHEVMAPEANTHALSPHAKVDCVACHVGPGAESYIKAKLNGTKQLYEVLTKTYHRPVPAPIEGRRTAKETCETCHWSQIYHGTKLSVYTHFRDDKEVTPYTSVLLMKTGGVHSDVKATGIHWHIHPKSIVDYVAIDEKLMEIPWVHVKRPDGSEATFVAEGVTRAGPPEGERRQMDCIDCHNRAAHDFETAEEVVDAGILEEKISRKIPFMRKYALAALQKPWTSENVVPGLLQDLLRSTGGEGSLDKKQLPLLEMAATYLVESWRRNVYPEMKIEWGTYKSLQSHEGCYRCHDDKHVDDKGNKISKDCSLCHEVLSNEEPDPEVLKVFNGTGK